MGRGGTAGFATIPRSVIAIAVLVVVVFAILAIRVKNRDAKRDDSTDRIPKITGASAIEIAETALQRSVDELVENPRWREGHSAVHHEDGTYDVKIFDAIDDGRGVYDPDVPRDCVRIVATGTTDADTVSIEGIWLDPAAAFGCVLAAGDKIQFGESEDGNCMVVGDLHNNAWDGGAIEIGAGTTVYGDVRSAGAITLGSVGSTAQAIVHGEVRGTAVTLNNMARIRDFERLSEWEEGVDLDLDGETDNPVVSRGRGSLFATHTAVSDGRSLADGETDHRVSYGTGPVRLGGFGPRTVIDPRPNFGTYFEFVTGSSVYPPGDEHVTTQIPGDGDGHYFESAEAFTTWIHTHYPTNTVCWRCAGDGRVDPNDDTFCPSCDATGREPSIEIAGVFYVDDELLDLSDLGVNLTVHGTIIVAKGNPAKWSRKTVSVPHGEMTIDHFPVEGRILIKGPSRMHFTQTYRSSIDGGSYLPYHRSVRPGDDKQKIPVPGPEPDRSMREFPALIAASQIVIEPRHAGFAYYQGDIGDEKMTILQGVVFAEDVVRLHGIGGWRGEPVVFDESVARADDDVFDEAILNIDLNDDGDRFDRVETSAISSRPVIPISRDRSNIDIDNDGVLGRVILGRDYREFFFENGYALPILIYHAGCSLGQTIQIGGQCLVTSDPLTGVAGTPFGFYDSKTFAARQGLISSREVDPQ
ncbi:MAG: hypothetical protein JSW58_09700 [Candidatus Latescibacterota bacterium]|nr:MAG: hypothetical protein JSW58_09700 [Candidatus Latescibacterota bacterium]